VVKEKYPAALPRRWTFIAAVELLSLRGRRATRGRGPRRGDGPGPGAGDCARRPWHPSSPGAIR